MSKRGSKLDESGVKIEDIIYLAGLIDGDGCFFISKRTKPTTNGYHSYMMKLQIHCIEESLIDWILSVFGGIKVIYNTKQRTGRRTLYGAEFTGFRLTRICEILIPHLKIKKRNAQNMLKIRNTYNGLGGNIEISQEIQNIRDECFNFSRAINTHKSLSVAPCYPSAMQQGTPSQLEGIY